MGDRDRDEGRNEQERAVPQEGPGRAGEPPRGPQGGRGPAAGRVQGGGRGPGGGPAPRQPGRAPGPAGAHRAPRAALPPGAAGPQARRGPGPLPPASPGPVPGRPGAQAGGLGGPDGPDGPGGPGRGSAPSGVTGRQRLKAALWPPRVTRAQLIVALLLFVLGLGLAIQVRSTSDDSVLRGARQEDLVRLLDEVDDRARRLEDEERRLEDQRTELENSSDQAEEARRQTEQKARELGVLAGTVAAQGPGITLTINDRAGTVEADMLLNTLQELRAAGAEAIQINDVRVVADTYFSDDLDSGGVRIDGRAVSEPYRFEVIGNPQDLEPALNIPGGVVQSLEKEQAVVSVRRANKIVVDALRAAEQPDYARSSTE